jgi:hypothetical protein
MRFLVSPVADLITTGNPGYSGNTINASGDKQFYAFRLDETATITTVGIRQNSRTNTTGSSPAAYTGTVRIGIQGLSTTTGLNDGTWIGGTNNYVDVSSWTAANDGKFVTVTLNDATLSRGVPYCVVAECTSHPGSGTLAIASTFSTVVLNSSFPYTFDETITTQQGKTANTGRFPFLLRSASKSYGMPIENWATNAIETDGSPYEVGLGFTMPTGSGTAYTVDGGFFQIASAGNLDFNFDMVLYEGTTALQTTTIDNAQLAAVGSTRRHDLPFDVSTLSTLTPGTEYILALKATSITPVTVREFTLATSGDKSAFGPFNFKYYSRTTGAWTEDTTRLPLFGLSIDTITTTASGGGYSANFNQGFGG